MTIPEDCLQFCQNCLKWIGSDGEDCPACRSSFLASFDNQLIVMKLCVFSSAPGATIEEPDLFQTIFSDCTGLIFNRGGFVVTVGDDRLTAVWSASTSNHFSKALEAGNDILSRLSALRARLNQSFQVTVALAKGQASVGSVDLDGHGVRNVFGPASRRVKAMLNETSDQGLFLDEGIIQASELDGDDVTDIPMSRVQGSVYRMSGSMKSPLRAQLVLDHFMGREREQELLIDHLNACREGESHSPGLLFWGESGVGKSRLCGHVLKRSTDDLRVLYDTCISQQSLDSGGLVIQWLVDLVGGKTEAELEQFFRDYPTLNEFENLLRVLLIEGYSGSVFGTDDKQIDTRLAQFFIECSRVEPLVLAGEDLHWVDELSLNVCRKMSQLQNADDQLLLVLDGRPAETVGLLREQSNLTSVKIHPVSESDVKKVVETIFDSPPDDEWLDQVLKRTDGKFVYLHQILNGMAEREFILETAEGWTVNSEVEGFPQLPDMDALIRSRINRMASPHRTVLLTAAVCGQKFPRSLLGELLEAEPFDLDRVLDDLQDKLFLIVKEETVAFEADAIREGALERLLPEEQRHLAEQLLSKFRETLSNSRYRSLIPEYFQFTRQEEKRQEWIIDQAHDLLRSWRLEEAERLLSLLEAEETFSSKRIEVQYLQEYSRYYEVAERDLDRAIETQRRAREIVSDTNAEDLLVEGLNRLGRLLIKKNQLAEAEEVIEQAIERAVDQEKDALRSKSQFMMGWRFEKDRTWDPALKHYRLSFAYSVTDEGQSYNKGSMARVLHRLGQKQRAYQLAEEAVLLKTHEEWLDTNPHLYGINLNVLGLLCFEHGEEKKALRILNTAVELGQVSNDRIVLSQALDILGEIAECVDQGQESEFKQAATDRGFSWNDLPPIDSIAVDGESLKGIARLRTDLNQILDLLDHPPRTINDVEPWQPAESSRNMDRVLDE